MKKKSPPYAIIGAVILGIIAIAAFVKYDKDQKAAAQAAIDAKAKADQALIDAANQHPNTPVTITPTDMRQVLYATQPVAPGVKINPAFYEKKLTPKDILPDAYTGDSDMTGWVAIRSIEKGDPLTPRNIGKSLPYMSQRISPGMRALALPVFNAEDNNTGGFIVDGDKVDLLLTRSTPDGILLNTTLVMQNLDVLYVPGPTIKTEQTEGINPVGPPGDAISVTFQVSPEQAQALVYMSSIKNAHFSMILRSRKDNSELHIKPFASEDYQGDYHAVQTRVVDKSMIRVQALADQIAAEEKKNQGTTNEDTPTPPPAP